MQILTNILKTLLLITILSCIGNISYAQNDVATATVVNSFPYVVNNFNSAGGGTAIGMGGTCHTIACCSVKVFKVITPSHGFLRADLSNFTPLTASIIAYTPNVANPTTWADITYYSDPSNFCGFRDSMQLQTGFANRPYWYGNGATDCYVPLTATINDALPPGEYYILVFAENQQISQSSLPTDLSFRFMPFCPQGYNCSSQAITSCLDASYTSPTGKIYTSSGSYQDTLFGAATGGLDSLIFTSLTINNDSYVQDTLQDTMLCPATDTLRAEASTDFVSYIELTKANSDWVEANAAVPALINSNRSVFTWIKKTATVSSSSQIIVGMNTSGSGNICNLQIGTNERLGIYDGSNTHYTGVVVTDGQWHYVGYTYDEATNLTKMYVDGQVEGSYSNGQSLTATSNRISIGQEFDGASSPGNFLDGILTEVSIWNEVLDSADIALAMQKAIDNTHPKYANLQAYYPMNKDCGADNLIIKDYSGKGNDGTASAADIQVGEVMLEQIAGFNSAAHFSKNWKMNSNTIATSNDLELTSYTGGNYSLELSRNYFTITDNWTVTLSGGCVVATPHTYVDVNATGNNDGSSWANAFTSLQEAIDSAMTGDSILVAQGTYLPSKNKAGGTSTGRDATYYINKNITILGGYPTGGGLNANPMLNKTILSGDLGVVTDASDNAYHVVWLDYLTNLATLDGIIIQDGNADDAAYPNDRGAGIFNNGEGANSSPTLNNCIIRWNNAGNMGAGLLNFANQNGTTSPTITGCLFYENSSAQGASIANSTFVGGANSTVITNSTFTDNIGASSIYNKHGNATITIQNSIVWETGSNPISNIGIETTLKYTLINRAAVGPKMINGGNNIYNINPEFIDAANDNYALKSISIAIEKGSNALLPNGYNNDLKGANRISGALVDLGAIELAILPNPIYVNHAAAGTNDGSSWSNAFIDMQTALTAALPGNEIWVATGTYKPTTGTDRTVSFMFRDGIKVYGGFAGAETTESQRNWASNMTILSGDIGTTSDASDNSYHVVNLKNVSQNTDLDGFVIEAGNANGTAYPNDRGAGIYNDGGNSGNSNPTIQNCIIRWNNAATMGGGILNFANTGGSTSPIITGCLFYKNTSAQGASIANSTYTGGSNSSVITNSTFADNTGASSIYNPHGNATITIQNSIVWDDNALYNYANETTIRYSSIKGASLAAGTTDGGNNQLAMNPLFVDAANDDYSLQAASPAIAVGNNAYLPAGYDLDLAHNARETGTTVEMGCYEDGANLSRPTLVQNEESTSSNTASEEQVLTGLEEKDVSLLEVATAATMTVYPNPVQDMVHINMKDVNQQATVRLLSTTGQVLIQEQVQADAQTVLQLNMGRLAKGMYLLNVQLEDGTQLNERVVKF